MTPYNRKIKIEKDVEKSFCERYKRKQKEG